MRALLSRELRSLELWGGGRGCTIIVSATPDRSALWLTAPAAACLERAAAWLGYDQAAPWQNVADAIADGRWGELVSQAVAFAEDEAEEEA